MTEGLYAIPSERSPTPAQRAVNEIAYVDLVDVCNLKCPTCVRGAGAIANTSKKMPLDKFTKIVAKIKSEGYDRIGLFNWTEPFLNRNLHDYIAVIKAQQLGCMVSTNFSLRRIDDLEAALKAGIDHLVITVSGFDQAVYEINHVAGNIEYVKKNTEKAAALKRNGEIATRIVLRFLKFNYNHEQEEKLRTYARELGIELEVIPGDDEGFRNRLADRTNEHYRKIIGDYRSERPLDPPGTICNLMMEQAVIDWQGNAFQCCAFPTHEAIQIGSYLDLPHEELLLRKLSHPICATCNYPRRAATPAHREFVMEAMRYRFDPSARDRRPPVGEGSREGDAPPQPPTATIATKTDDMAGATGAVTADDVHLGYRLVLGRDPESVDAVRAHMASADFRSLLSTLIASDEHQQRPGGRMTPPPGPKPTDPAVTEADVVWCYRSFLEREPESPQVVQNYIATAPDFRSLVSAFVGGDEYRTKLTAAAAPAPRPEDNAPAITEDDVV